MQFSRARKCITYVYLEIAAAFNSSVYHPRAWGNYSDKKTPLYS
jgi:hypothetical protein